MHLDLAVDDLDETEAAAIRLGAHGARVFFDSAGSPFRLSIQISG